MTQIDHLLTHHGSSQHARVLALDHFYGQDLDALEEAGGATIEIIRIPYQRIHRLARRHFPEDAFADVRSSALAQYRSNWKTYQRAADELVDWLFAAHRPELMIIPSDTIFYFRPLITSFASRGIRTVVVQKETTISPMTMDIDSQYVADSVPFMSDYMTVCSERHRSYWLRQGVSPELIIVTGQPRFDYYARPMSPRPPGSLPRLLYFSYDDFAYLPYDGVSTPMGDWRALRRETESVLASLATAKTWEVVAKMHPQQISLDDWLGPDVVHAPTDGDTRDLIRSADAVVGFQTTALFEAALAGKPVIYPAWGPVFERAHHLLVPFEEYGDLVEHVQSAGALRELLLASPDARGRPGASARSAATQHLGPVDGHASERVLEILRKFLPSAPALAARPPASRLTRAAAMGAGVPLLKLGAEAARRLGRADLAAAAVRRSTHWAQEAREAVTIVARPPFRSRTNKDCV